MNLLALVQALHREGGFPGNAPTDVAGQTGRANDLVRWTIEAWHDIQRHAGGRWKWLRRPFTIDTIANDQTYTSANATDTVDSVTITRFRRWNLDEEEPWFIYLVSDGKSTEQRLPQAEHWYEFRQLYVIGEHTAAYPAQMAVHPDDTIYLGPKPNGIYRITGDYWMSNQALAANTDVPEMPADYHMAIPYRAMTKYAYNVVAQNLLARAATEGNQIFEALIDDQWYGSFTLRWPSALA